MGCEEEPVRCPDSGVLGNLGRLVRLGIAQTLRLFSDLGKTIGDGTRKKSTLRSSLLETERGTLFYCNSLKAILNPQQTLEKRSFSQSFLHALLFLEKAGSSKRLKLYAIRAVHLYA